MYEMKKVAAQKTIEKKQSKVEEINKLLADEITPTLEKLRKERTAYQQWVHNNTEIERLARFCVAHEFFQLEQAVAAAAEGAVAAQQVRGHLVSFGVTVVSVNSVGLSE
jgi:structural maintenance of chromosome 2